MDDKLMDDILSYTPMQPGIDPTYGCEPDLETMVRKYYLETFDIAEADKLTSTYISILKGAFDGTV